MQVLIDSSVWIEYFRTGSPVEVDQLIQEDLVVTNDIVLTELIPVLKTQKKKEVIESLTSLSCKPLQIDWDIIRHYQYLNIQNGINKVGIPDLIILHQVVEENYTLFSLDRHFELMQAYFEFKLLH